MLYASTCLISSVYKEIGYCFFIHSQTSHRPRDILFLEEIKRGYEEGKICGVHSLWDDIYIYIYMDVCVCVFGWGEGESKIPLFFEIINVLSLFEKYLTMYYFFEIRVWHETRVSWKSSLETFFFLLEKQFIWNLSLWNSSSLWYIT